MSARKAAGRGKSKGKQSKSLTGAGQPRATRAKGSAKAKAKASAKPKGKGQAKGRAKPAAKASGKPKAKAAAKGQAKGRTKAGSKPAPATGGKRGTRSRGRATGPGRAARVPAAELAPEVDGNAALRAVAVIHSQPEPQVEAHVPLTRPGPSAAAAVRGAHADERRRFREQVHAFAEAAPEALAVAGATSVDAVALAALGGPAGPEETAPFPGASRVEAAGDPTLFGEGVVPHRPAARRAARAEAEDELPAPAVAESPADQGPTLFDLSPLPAAATDPACAADAHGTRRSEQATARDAGIERLHALPCTVGEVDRYLFNEGRHRRLWEMLGSHPREWQGERGTSFAVWAPNARRVSVVGDFCDWDGRRYPLRPLGASGIWELFVPGVHEGELYKYEIEGADGALRLKADPVALKHEQFPGDASIVQRLDHHAWGDAEWMAARAQGDPTREPVAIYEVHLSSWFRVAEEDDRPLTYREIAPRLAEHCRRHGFTHVELMPVMEHPFGGSWGYQVTGYFAPTSRHGTPDDFRFLVDTLHRAGIGVILDWVPGHFPADAHALARFDGTPLYEHEDPREGLHPDWDTLVFNYGRHEVRSFMLSSALYWLQSCHADGLRVDAVASMIYRDYSRRQGEWVPNRYGGRENLEALDFLRELNTAVRATCPGAMMIAEESTAWNGVTRDPAHDGGLGFHLKWNMGWMHDTLAYFARDPIHRRWHQDQLTFAMLYEHSERFLNPLSHDEVVHGKGSLYSRMPGDEWQKLANLRALLAYMWTRPGKKLVFMGTELAMPGEWDHDHGLPWHLADDPPRRAFGRFVEDLGRLYRSNACLWRDDAATEGFRWIACDDRENSVLVYERRAPVAGDGREGPDHLVVVLNLTPVPRLGYRIGAPSPGTYRCRFSSDAAVYGGSDHPTRDLVAAEPRPLHGHPQSIVLDLPPLAAVVYAPEG